MEAVVFFTSSSRQSLWTPSVSETTELWLHWLTNCPATKQEELMASVDENGAN